MTQMAMRFPYPRTSFSAAPLRRRLRGAAMAAAFMVGSATAPAGDPHRYADRGAALAPTTSEPLWTAPAPTAAEWSRADEPAGTPVTAATLHGAIHGTSPRRGFVHETPF